MKIHTYKPHHAQKKVIDTAARIVQGYVTSVKELAGTIARPVSKCHSLYFSVNGDDCRDESQER